MKVDESSLIKRILDLVVDFPRFGYRRITRLLRSEGWRVNAKRVYRLWRQEGLKVPKKTVKRRRLGGSEGGILRRRAEHKDHVWSVDFIFDRNPMGVPLRCW
jgi:transposase InsO family protein